MHPSSARLGSARIQLELEAFQLGSAREIFEPARLAKIGLIRAKIGKMENQVQKVKYCLLS